MLTMRKSRKWRDASGLTLIELVVVLGISGLIFSGLWGLLTSGSSQLQAQSAAQQYRQVITAMRKALASLPLAASGTCAAVSAPGINTNVTITPYCLVQYGFLNANFATASGTTYTDAFGHTINAVARQIDASGTKFRFMVYSSGGTKINDKTGAMVASLIGSEGGFMYEAATEGCSTATTAASRACGAFGSFAVDVTTYAATNPGVGHITTLSYTDDNGFLDSPWLARSSGLGITYNTMQTALYLGGQNIDMSTSTATTGGGSLLVDGGNVVMQSGKICMGGIAGTVCDPTGTGTISALSSLTGSRSASTSMTFPLGFSMVAQGTNPITITSGSSVNLTTANHNSVIINGTSTLDTLLTVNGTATAQKLYANTFIYGVPTSDQKLKANLIKIDSALEKLTSLNGYYFDWKANKKHDIGVVAQEVEKVFPEVVTQVNETTKGVDYAKLIAPMIEALRELKQQNEALRHEVDELKKKAH